MKLVKNLSGSRVLGSRALSLLIMVDCSLCCRTNIDFQGFKLKPATFFNTKERISNGKISVCEGELTLVVFLVSQVSKAVFTTHPSKILQIKQRSWVQVSGKVSPSFLSLPYISYSPQGLSFRVVWFFFLSYLAVVAHFLNSHLYLRDGC